MHTNLWPIIFFIHTIKICIYPIWLKYWASNLSLSQVMALFYLSSLGLNFPPGRQPQKGNLHTWWKSLATFGLIKLKLTWHKKNLYLLIKYPNCSREAMKGKCRLTGDNYNCSAMSGWLEARAWKNNVFTQALVVLRDCWGSLIETDFTACLSLSHVLNLNTQDFPSMSFFLLLTETVCFKENRGWGNASLHNIHPCSWSHNQ